MSNCLIRKVRNSSERYPVKTAGGRKRDTIVEASEAYREQVHPYTEKRNLIGGGRCFLALYFSVDLAMRYSQSAGTRCFEGASQP